MELVRTNPGPDPAGAVRRARRDDAVQLPARRVGRDREAVYVYRPVCPARRPLAAQTWKPTAE